MLDPINMQVYDAATGRPVREDSRGASNSLSVDQFLRREFQKRPSVGLTGRTAGGPAKRARLPSYKAGNVPSMRGVNIGYQDGIVDLQSNTTASLPLMCRPYAHRYEKHYTPYTPLFVCASEIARLHTIADIPTMNYFLRMRHYDKDNACTRNMEPQKTGNTRNKAADEGVIATAWHFQGVLRGEIGAGTLQKLLNVDVFGRSRVSNIFGKVHIGDVVGIDLVQKKLNEVIHLEPNGASAGDARLTGGAFEDSSGDKYVMQWEGTINGTSDSFIPIGVVSNAVGVERDRQNERERAHLCSHDLTKLPTIEILMM